MASDALISLVKGCEGFHRVVAWKPTPLAVPYLCPAGYWTQGWGHLVRKDSPAIDEETGENWLSADLAVAERAARRQISVELTQGQWDAITDYVFNLGEGRLRGSTLRRVINRGEFDRVPAEFRKWVYGGGVKLPGLVRRRELDVVLWNS